MFRHVGADGLMREDVLALLHEHRPGDGLLQPAMRAGQTLAAAPAMSKICARAQAQLASEVDASQDEHAAADRARWEQDAE